MKRRGFLSSLLALVAAPFAPKVAASVATSGGIPDPDNLVFLLTDRQWEMDNAAGYAGTFTVQRQDGSVEWASSWSKHFEGIRSRFEPGA